MSRRTWLYVLGGVAAAGVVLVVAVVAAGFLFFRSHVQTTTMGPEAARSEFERALVPFNDVPPLIGARGEANRAEPVGDRRPVKQLHVMAYDPEDERLVNITVPGWLLRLAPHGHSSIKIDGTEVLESAPGKHITIDDLERHGPGLVLDQQAFKRRGRVIVWSE